MCNPTAPQDSLHLPSHKATLRVVLGGKDRLWVRRLCGCQGTGRSLRTTLTVHTSRAVGTSVSSLNSAVSLKLL